MDAEVYKLQELWRTGQITDAQFVERSNQITQVLLTYDYQKRKIIKFKMIK